jgi:putative endonuclease
MKSNNKIIGDHGERLVEKTYLKSKYEKLISNYRSRCGEIDLIFQKKNQIIFVEVKARTEYKDINPVDAVNLKKRLNIIKTAKFFCLENKIDEDNFNFRFDVASVFYLDFPSKFKIEIIENAYDSKGRI